VPRDQIAAGTVIVCKRSIMPGSTNTQGCLSSTGTLNTRAKAIPDFHFQYLQLRGKFLVRRKYFSMLHESTNHEQAHFYRLIRPQHVAKHQGAMLGKGKGWKARVTMFLGTGHNL
jgi:hypothetical protein